MTLKTPVPRSVSEIGILRQLRLDKWPNSFKSECYPLLALLSENLPKTIIPTSDPNDPLNSIGTLLREANRQQSAGHFRDAEISIAEARRLARGHNQALAEIDFFCALSLLQQDKQGEGVLSRTS